MSTHNENLAQNLGANSNLKPNLNPNSNSSPKALPKTWQIKPLGEVCEIIMGQSPLGENVVEKSKNTNSQALEFHQGKICFTDKFISASEVVTTDIRKIAPENSVLLCVRAPVGVVNITQRQIAIGRGLCALNLKGGSNEFLYFYLLTLKDYFNQKATGSTFSAINLDIVKKTEIPLPTMEIQRQIVQRLDAAFEKIDKAVARLKSAKSNLTRYKQSLLKAAFNGTLTKSPHATWQSKTLGEILDYEQPSKYIVKSTKYDDSFQTPVLTAGKSFILGYTDEKDGIFTQIPVIIFDDFTTATKFVDFEFKVKSSAMKILHAKENADIKFVFYYMQTIHHRSDTHKRYWIGEYSKHKILLPPLQTQKEIVQILERHFEGADRTEKFIDSALNRAKMLKQSLLKAAFEGALVQ